jgi:hypothetical protein
MAFPFFNNNFYINRMKKLPLPILVVLVFILSYGCSKNNNNTSPTSSEWSYNDTTFKGYITGYDSISLIPQITSLDSLGNKIYVMFTVRPKVNSQYAVVADVFDSLNKGNYATISISRAHTNYDYSAIGKAGDMVTATIVDDKVHVTFSNISLYSFTGQTTISGTLIQTIP